MNIPEQQVKELVNSLIDLANENRQGFTDNEMMLRRCGIELAIIRINSRLLNNASADETKKYNLSESLLKTA